MGTVGGVEDGIASCRKGESFLDHPVLPVAAGMVGIAVGHFPHLLPGLDVDNPTVIVVAVIPGFPQRIQRKGGRFLQREPLLNVVIIPKPGQGDQRLFAQLLEVLIDPFAAEVPPAPADGDVKVLIQSAVAIPRDFHATVRVRALRIQAEV